MIKLRVAGPDDVAELADLAELTRAEYAHYEPDFWRPAPTARLMHTPFLSFLVGAPEVTVLVAERTGRIDGFLAARVSSLPPALGVRGRLCLIDDFAVRRRADWADAGCTLLAELRARLAAECQGWLIAVCGHRDRAKSAALLAAGLEPRCGFRLRRLDEPPRDVAGVRRARSDDAEALFELARAAPPRLHGMQLVWREPRTVRGYRELCDRPDCTTLVAAQDGRIEGYALAMPALPAPPVYEPGGTTCLVDELEAARPEIRAALLYAIEGAAREAGDVQVLLACAARDRAKRAVLDARGYRWPVDWFSAPLPWGAPAAPA